MSETNASHTSPEAHESSPTLTYAGPMFGEGQPKLLRLGGALGIAGCVIGLVILVAVCAGMRKAFVMSFIPLVMGLVGFVLAVVGGVLEKKKYAQEDTHVLAALFATCMSVIGGLVLMAAWLGWTTYR
jgi:hypothetical protein